MEFFTLPQEPYELSGFSLVFLLLNLLVGAALATLLKWHYVRYARVIANRETFSDNFIAVVLSVVLIISIVKSSLALSLGLVGALSIVRFRTPIKEPEELTYLFLAIAVGLGLGANQLLATVGAFLFIILLLTLRARRPPRPEDAALYLEVDLPAEEKPGAAQERLLKLLGEQVKRVKLARVDAGQDSLLVSCELHCDSQGAVAQITDAIRAVWPKARVSFFNHSDLRASS